MGLWFIRVLLAFTGWLQTRQEGWIKIYRELSGLWFVGFV
jgi:hypothetical protein